MVTPADCKSAAPGTVGSTPTASTNLWFHGIMVITLACHAGYRGSIPLGTAKISPVSSMARAFD